MTEQDAFEILERVGAIQKGHFVLSGGYHTDRYVDKHRALFSHYATFFYITIASKFRGRGIEAVVGPVEGGAIMAKGVASHLSMADESNVFPVYAQKDGKGVFFIQESLAPLVKGKNVLVVDDVLTTGRSAKKTMNLVRHHGGRVVGVGGICNRGGEVPKMMINLGKEDLIVLAEVKIQAWTEEDCELCKSGMPVNTELGHGQEFLVRKGRGQAAV